MLGGLLISNKKEGQPASAITLSQLLHIRTIHEQSNTWLSETASNFLWRNLAPICEITLLCWLFLADKEAICCSGQFVFVENKKGRKEKYFSPIFGYTELPFSVKVYAVKIWKCWDMFFDKKSIVSVHVHACKHFFHPLLTPRWCTPHVWSVAKLQRSDPLLCSDLNIKDGEKILDLKGQGLWIKSPHILLSSRGIAIQINYIYLALILT